MGGGGGGGCLAQGAGITELRCREREGRGMLKSKVRDSAVSR